MQRLMDALVRIYGNAHKMVFFHGHVLIKKDIFAKRTLGFSGKEARTLWGEMNVRRQQEAPK